MVFRFSVFLRSVVPLQAFVSDKVQVMYAPKSFDMSDAHLGEESVHLCSQVADASFFDNLADKQTIYDKSVSSIRTVLKAF
jgi:hypothetical protein